MGNVDRAYMERALRMAFAGMGITSPNPSVGAVLVRDGEIVSTGATCACGGDHAEVCALKNAGAHAQGCDLYVTLEPCCHHGRTPPCTDALIASGVRRVVVPILDPNPHVAGRGVERLRSAGIEVVMMDEMASEARDLIRPFEKYILRARPFIIHKAALSLDGRIATRTGDSRWISDDSSRYIVHRLRSLADAIIVGSGTVEKDNPALTVRMDSFSDDVRKRFGIGGRRLEGYGNHFIRLLLESEDFNATASPLRVVIGIPDAPLMGREIMGDGRVLLIGSEEERGGLRRRADRKFLGELEKTGRLEFVDGAGPAGMVDNALRLLHGRGILMAVLEGGGALAPSFFEAGPIDQYLNFITPRVFGGGVPVINGAGVELVAESLRLRDVTTVALDGDVLYGAYAEKR
jgi:diaminohydroxyphosphoribosylaminopyrimidine deaminase/5-amino-6-(5-phosphoribosylamino)uracil reductase